MEGGWAEDVTDSDGSYTLNVSPGTWEIGFNPPMPKDGSASPYLPAPPKRIKSLIRIKPSTSQFVKLEPR